MKKCETCGKFISDWNRHRRGLRSTDKHGHIIYGPRCERQHRRGDTVLDNRHPTHHGGVAHSQSYS